VCKELIAERGLISTLSRDIRLATRGLGLYETQDEKFPELPFVRYTVGWEVAMRGKSRDKEGETRLDTFRHNGIIIREVMHDEAQGWSRVAELLGTFPDGRPMLTIAPSCVHLVRALTNAVSDPNDPELLMESTNDQPLRALRLGAMSRPAPKPFEPPPLPKKAVGHLLNECRAALEPSGGIEWT
jgi:hypothetical protein